MPVYEYRCTQCHDEFELVQRITAEPGGTCPGCGSTQVHRLISLTSFQLKGGGWYVTDYGGRKKGADAAKSNGDGPANGSAKGSEKGKDGSGGGEGSSIETKGSDSAKGGDAGADKGSTSASTGARAVTTA